MLTARGAARLWQSAPPPVHRRSTDTQAHRSSVWNCIWFRPCSKCGTERLRSQLLQQHAASAAGDASALAATLPELDLVAPLLHHRNDGVTVLHLQLSRSLRSLYAVTIENISHMVARQAILGAIRIKHLKRKGVPDKSVRVTGRSAKRGAHLFKFRARTDFKVNNEVAVLVAEKTAVGQSCATWRATHAIAHQVPDLDVNDLDGLVDFCGLRLSHAAAAFACWIVRAPPAG